ncbi:MAG: alanine--tRNA ligase [Clostridia bacterium]|nr:alanine--tRNA ligase [Clostridia bacterium]
MITSKQLRNSWIKFYEERGHKNIGAVSLIGDGSTGVMFNVAGMQPLMPYLLGAKHPSGKTRLCNVQGCVRTVDIESVGDPTHFTFFEMMGNWSLGDYFKKEKTQWSYDILTKVFGLDGNEICSTVFEGNDAAPRDEETAELLKKVGIKPEHIFYLPKKDNWWELEGTVGTPCGPDNEWFYPRHDKPCGPNCGPDCGCGRYVEIGNDVYMQYKKTATGYEPLANKNVDTGFGLDRLLAFLNGVTDGYKTDLFMPVINYLEEKSGKKYDEDEEARKAMRIIADHIRTSTMLIGDVNGIVPSNVGAGYILRRLLRRAIRYARKLGVEMTALTDVSKIFIEKIYDEAYPLLVEKEDYVISEIAKETAKFETTLATGLKEFNKCVEGIERKNAFMAQKDPAYVPEKGINGKQAFRLYDTFGFPLELTEELASEVGYTVDAKGFEEAFKEHQEKSKQQPQGVFKGGLEEQNEITARLHTATHLLNAALKSVLKDDNINQKGSNITVERLRFDFNFDRKLLPEELKAVEDWVNEAIKADVPVTLEEMSVDEAKAQGAVGVFTAKYGDKVKVYTMGKYSKEICGGPHASHTGELHHFRIVKEEASSAGVRRIKAVLD